MPPRISESERERRIWMKVRKTNTCWIWTGAKNHGYGQACIGHGRSVAAHVWVYRKLVGEVPVGLELDHLCRNRACVNPAHLEPVTHRVNCLRGEGLSARRAKMTHCHRGHEFTLENTYISKDNERRCRRCVRERLARIRRSLGKPLARGVRTECVHGHPFDETNTRLRNNRRRCKACDRIRAKAARKREQVLTESLI